MVLHTDRVLVAKSHASATALGTAQVPMPPKNVSPRSISTTTPKYRTQHSSTTHLTKGRAR